MSKPAARIGDMHVCPMVTPGVPPVPHVGGPIMGPGVPTVLIGNMPAAVMGDMCTCVGPPDSLILGSTGVLIGGKPAVRMGDITVHGGSVVVGCPTVLIGEISPGTVMTKQSLTVLEQLPPKASGVAQQVLSMQQAADEGKPFCEVCGEVSNVPPKKEEEKQKEIEKMPQLLDFYITDKQGNRIENAKIGEEILLVVKTANMVGVKVNISLSNNKLDYKYQGKRLDNDILKNYTLKYDEDKLRLKVIKPKDSLT